MLAVTQSHQRNDDLLKKLDQSTVVRRPNDHFLESGPIIFEYDEGTKCENCKDECPGYKSHEWRKTCQACKCPRADHAIYHEQMTSVCERIGFKSDALNLTNVSSSGTVDPKQMGYIWVPPGLVTSAKIQQYFNQLPSEKVPKLNSSGEKYRNKMLLYQLPKQDLALAYCKYVDKEHAGSYEDFIAARNEIALDIGYVKDAPQKASCNHCTKAMQSSELAVCAPKLRENMNFHPNCFTCTTCDELLVDLTYCVYEDKIYCERHYVEILKPRCSACDEVSTSNKKVSEKDPKHDQSPVVRRREKDANAPKRLTMRDSEDYEDSEEASLLHNIKDEQLELDVDNQYLNDPQIKEMTNYVKKLTKARIASMDEDEEETEYYWKPGGGAPETRRKSIAEVLIVPKSENPKAQNTKIEEDLALEREALEYQEHWRLDNLKVDEDVFDTKHFNSPRASGYRSKSHSIAYESTKFAGHRRDSLAEMIIIPKTVRESCESSDHLLQQLENEALEYQQVWGIDVPQLKEQARNRSQSITVAQLARDKATGHDAYNLRRESIAELLIVPRTVRESIDESVLIALENEALAYQYAWNLNPEEVGKRTKNRSMSISMGVLSRKKRARPSISRRRQSLAEAIIVPKTQAEMVVDDPHLLSLLENEAYEYKQAFGLRTPEILETFDEEESKPDYNEWFHRFDDQTTAHIETTTSFTDDEDEEVADLMRNANGEVQVQNHIFYTFPKRKSPAPPSKSATPDTVIRAPIRPTTPADYNNYMQKFPDQLSPEITMDDGRKSPATLETYMAQNQLSPIPSPRALTPEPPPTMEVYLERMRSASPQPPLPSIEIETSATPVIQPTPVAFPQPRALTPLRTMQHPPSLETYLERLRSQSPQAETEY